MPFQCFYQRAAGIITGMTCCPAEGAFTSTSDLTNPANRQEARLGLRQKPSVDDRLRTRASLLGRKSRPPQNLGQAFWIAVAFLLAKSLESCT